MNSKVAFFITCIICIQTGTTTRGQILNLTGGDVGLSRGNINTEVLTQLIQQKQDELQQKVFRDIIIANFAKADPAVRNFTTYYYMYNVMKTITTEKNKKIITQDLVQRTSELALVYGFASFFVDKGYEKYADVLPYYNNLEKLFPSSGIKIRQQKFDGPGVSVKSIGGSDMYESKVQKTSVQTTFATQDEIEKLNAHRSVVFNYLVDMAYHAMHKDKDIISRNIFKQLTIEDSVWYKVDNEFFKLTFQLDQLRAQLVAQNDAFKEIVEKKTSASELIDAINAQPNLKEISKKKSIKVIIDQLVAAESRKVESLAIFNEMKKALKGFMTNYDAYHRLNEFFKDLKAKEQGWTNLTEEQYLAMRSIVKEAIELIRFNHENSVVAKITEFLLDYTVIEINKDTTEQSTLYVDIESLISALDDHYNSKNRKSSVSSALFWINPRPFFSIGTNYASFFNNNQLGSADANDNTQSLDRLYFASEKIGIKIKFFDRAYSRSFVPGEKFNYKGSQRVWYRPQKEAIISNVHLIAYGSGLLYNLVDLKSNKAFDYGIAGASLGVTFYNGLSINAGVACPFTNHTFRNENAFFNFGLDIPIIEYIAAVAKTNKK